MKTIISLLFILTLTFACTSSATNKSISQTDNLSIPLNPSPSVDNAVDYDKQMNVAELRQRLDEVKEIELEARKMVALRNDWGNGVTECMQIMNRLKPRAREIQGEHKRMLSPAGIEIAGAAMFVNVCVNCVENDDDSDCRVARESINKAEKELKKEMRQK